MNREEQIDWLCRLRSWLTNVTMPKEWRPKFSQALSDAIKALEQEPSVWDDKGELTEYGEKCREHILEQQPCGDAISRQAAISILAECAEHTNPYSDALDYIEALPPVYAEKVGEWKRGFGNTSCTCSECGGNGESIFKYCPNCGAKMVEPKESEK